MAQQPDQSIRGRGRDTPEVDAAERKIGAVLADLEDSTGAEVKHLELEDVVDTDAEGRPVVKRAVDITVEHRPQKKAWSR